MRSRRLCDVAAASLLLLASRYYVTPGSLSRLRAYATPRPQHRNHTGTFASLPPAAAGGAAGPPPRRPSFRNDTAVAPVDRRRPHRARAAPAAPAAPARVPFLMCDRRTPYAVSRRPSGARASLPRRGWRNDEGDGDGREWRRLRAVRRRRAFAPRPYPEHRPSAS